MSNAYSNKDFTGQDLSNRTDMSGLTIENSCFSNEQPNAMVFPDDMTGVTFVDCNLDNIFVPPGNSEVRGSHRYFQVQNDGEDWIVDKDTLEPIEPMNPRIFEMHGLSVNPKDIPGEVLPMSIVTLKKEAIEAAKTAVIAKAEQDFNAVDVATIPVETVDAGVK